MRRSRPTRGTVASRSISWPPEQRRAFGGEVTDLAATLTEDAPTKAGELVLDLAAIEIASVGNDAGKQLLQLADPRLSLRGVGQQMVDRTARAA